MRWCGRSRHAAGANVEGAQVAGSGAVALIGGEPRIKSPQHASWSGRLDERKVLGSRRAFFKIDVSVSRRRDGLAVRRRGVENVVARIEQAAVGWSLLPIIDAGIVMILISGPEGCPDFLPVVASRATMELFFCQHVT